VGVLIGVLLITMSEYVLVSGECAFFESLLSRVIYVELFVSETFISNRDIRDFVIFRLRT
jgi:hypothetical protein